MLVRTSETSLRRHLRRHDLDPGAGAGADLADLSSAMIDWYGSVRAWDAQRLSLQGDGLLLEWGTSRPGGVETFSVSLTRQLALVGLDGLARTLLRDRLHQPGLWQLALTSRYEPTSTTASVGSGSHWCFDLDGVPALRDVLVGSGALEAASGSPLRVRELVLCAV